MFSESVDGLIYGQVHLVGVGDGEEQLLLEGCCPAVPEKRGSAAHVHHAWCIAGAEATVDSGRDREGIGKSESGLVATGARDGLVFAQDRIRKKHGAEVRFGPHLGGRGASSSEEKPYRCA